MRRSEMRFSARCGEALCSMATILLLSGSGLAQAADEVATALEKVAAIQQQVNALQAKSMEGYSPDMSLEEEAVFRKRMMEIMTDEVRPRVAEAHGLLIPFAEDERVLEGLVWTITYDPGSNHAKAAAEAMAEHHLTDPALLQLVSRFQYAPMPWTIPTLEKILTAEISDQSRIQAMVTLAGCCKSMSKFPAMLDSVSEADRKLIAEQYGDDHVQLMRGANAADLEARAIKLYEDLARDFGNQEFNGRSVKQVVDNAIFEIRYLSIGKTAPEIEGEDVNGVGFKLSDYRGKVVMLDFWGDW